MTTPATTQQSDNKLAAIQAARMHFERTGGATVAYPAADGRWIAVERSTFDDRAVYAPHDGMKQAVHFPPLTSEIEALREIEKNNRELEARGDALAVEEELAR